MPRIVPFLLALVLLAFAMPGFADGHESGFLDNYDQLEPVDDPWIDFMYMSPDFSAKLGQATAIIVRQPEIFLAADSKYKGIKPDEMKTLADIYRDVMAEALSQDYQIAASPGPNTIDMQMALTNVHLKKKGRMILGYTPVGLVATTAKRQLLDDLTDKILLTEVAWEGRLVDAESGKIIGSIIIELGDNTSKKEFTSWDELVQAMEVSAARLRCRFGNASLPEGARQDCMAITSL